MKHYYVYLLKCSDESYYTGITDNLEQRLAEHNNGLNRKCYTYSRKPLKLLFYETFQNPNDAIKFEKQIKGWSRKKKEALINKDWQKLVEFSRSKSHPSTGSG